MTPEILSGLAGMVLSLFFSYVPGAEGWFGKLEPTYKRLVMVVAIVLASVGVYALSCAGWLNWLSCDEAGQKKLAELFFIVLTTNQSTFLLSPKKAKVEPVTGRE